MMFRSLASNFKRILQWDQTNRRVTIILKVADLIGDGNPMNLRIAAPDPMLLASPYSMDSSIDQITMNRESDVGWREREMDIFQWGAKIFYPNRSTLLQTGRIPLELRTIHRIIRGILAFCISQRSACPQRTTVVPLIYYAGLGSLRVPLKRCSNSTKIISLPTWRKDGRTLTLPLAKMILLSDKTAATEYPPFVVHGRIPLAPSWIEWKIFTGSIINLCLPKWQGFRVWKEDLHCKFLSFDCGLIKCTLWSWNSRRDFVTTAVVRAPPCFMRHILFANMRSPRS
jgi:hypothetical protein